jgi:hypothetical protein
MGIKDLVNDPRTSIDEAVASSVDAGAFSAAMRRVQQYGFWSGRSKPALLVAAWLLSNGSFSSNFSRCRAPRFQKVSKRLRCLFIDAPGSAAAAGTARRLLSHVRCREIRR